MPSDDTISDKISDRYPRLLAVLSALLLIGVSAYRASLVEQGRIWMLLILSLTLGFTLFNLLSERIRSLQTWQASRMQQLTKLFGITHTQAWLLLSGLLCSFSGSIAAGNGPYPFLPISLPLWLLGLVLIILSLRTSESMRTLQKVRKQDLVLLIPLLALGAYLRMIALAEMPFVLSGDEGSVGLVGWEYVEGSRTNIHSLGWFSFPALYSWLLSLSQTVFDRSVFAIRWISAISGTLTIGATFFAGQLLFNRRIGLIASTWLLAFHYHVFFSRVAYNNVFDSLFLILCLGFLYRGWKDGGRDDFVWLGLALGFSQYFYTTSHAIPIILILWLPWLHLKSVPLTKRLPHLLTALIIAGVVMLPLIVIYLGLPTSLTFTAGRVSLLDPDLIRPAAEALGMTPLSLVLEQTLVTALGLTVAELQGIYAASGQPMMFGLSALIFMIGVLISLFRWRHPRQAVLLITVGLSILIGGLSIQAPSSQRLILLPPVLALLIALPLDRILSWSEKQLPSLRQVLRILIILTLCWMLIENVYHLFRNYFPNENYGSLNGEVTQEMIEFLETESPDIPIYFIGGERMAFSSIPSITYLLPDYHATSVVRLEDLHMPETTQARSLFIVLPEQQSALEQLASIYPESVVIARYNRDGRLLFYARIIELEG